MNVLCGTDLVEIDRIRSNITSDDFLKRVYTDIEIRYCEERKAGAAGSYAARFAAKEAFVKALGTGFTDGISLKDIEVQRDDGKPRIVLYNRAKEIIGEMGAYSIDLSLTHTDETASAVVVILIEE